MASAPSDLDERQTTTTGARTTRGTGASGGSDGEERGVVDEKKKKKKKTKKKKNGDEEDEGDAVERRRLLRTTTAAEAAARRILLSVPPDRFESVLADLRVIIAAATAAAGGDDDDDDAPLLLKDDDAWIRDARITAQKKENRGTSTTSVSTAALLLRFLARSSALRRARSFLHARTGPRGCRLSGYIRVSYASIFLYSRILMAFDLQFLLDPAAGVMPYRATRYMLDDYQSEAADAGWSVFGRYPDSPVVLYGTFGLGLLNGLLLLLGIAPRLQAVGVFWFLRTMHGHDQLLYDHQDVMLRLWSFFLILMPLDHITVYDGFGFFRNHPPSSSSSSSLSSSSKQTTSWPMWPFQLWRITTCMVYMGAGLGKAGHSTWQSGTALYWCLYDEGFGLKLAPNLLSDWLFNRMITVKLLTWPVVLLESSCWILIWPKRTRRATFAAIVALHVGIELTMVMHVFQYLSVLGWIVFFAEPNDGDDDGKGDDKEAMSITTESSEDDKSEEEEKLSAVLLPKTRRQRRGRRFVVVLQSVVALTLLYLLVIDQLPTAYITEILPTVALRYHFWMSVHQPRVRLAASARPLLETCGLRSEEWELFTDTPSHENRRYTAVITYRNGSEPVLWRSPSWLEMTIMERERHLWSDSFYYYIGHDSQEAVLPVLKTFVEYLARVYSDGAVAYEVQTGGGRLVVRPDNAVSSISLMYHGAEGVVDPDTILGWFEPARRPPSTFSECLYAVSVSYNGEEEQSIDVRYEYDEEKSLGRQNGCLYYNQADDALHRMGSYAPHRYDEERFDGWRALEEEWEEAREEDGDEHDEEEEDEENEHEDENEDEESDEEDENEDEENDDNEKDDDDDHDEL